MYVFCAVGHRCGDTLALADERSDVGARVPPVQNLAPLILVGIWAARQRRPWSLDIFLISSAESRAFIRFAISRREI